MAVAGGMPPRNVLRYDVGVDRSASKNSAAWLLVGFVIAVVPGGLWLIQAFPTQPAASSVDSEPARGGDGPLVGELGAVPDAGQTVDRGDAAIPTEMAKGAPSTLRVRVLREADRTPVAGATVGACELKRFFRKVAAAGDVDRAGRNEIRKSIESRARTDAQGLADLAVTGERQLVIVEHSELYGRTSVKTPAEGAVEVLVAVDRSLRVLVRSATTRRPVSGVRMAFTSAKGSGSMTVTDAQGIATWPHAQLLLPLGQRGHVGFAVPLPKKITAPVDRQALAGPPLEMILPETGEVRVRVRDQTGRPVRGETMKLHLVVVDERAGRRSVHPRVWLPGLDATGTSRARHLGLGMKFRLTVAHRGAASRHRPVVVTFVGPTQPTEVVEKVVVWQTGPEGEYPGVAGRLVRRDGTPWVNAEIRAKIQFFPWIGHSGKSETFRTDAEGGFELVLRRPCPKGGRRTYDLTPAAAVDPAGGASGRETPATELRGIEARLDLSRDFPPGTTSLGEVVLDRGLFLVSGRVVDERGEPIAAARVTLTQQVVEKRRDYWPGYDCAGGYPLGEDGRFELHAIPGRDLPTGRLRLRARAPGHFAEKGSDVQLGSKGVDLVLRRAGGLAGSVALADGQSAADIRVSLVREADGKRLTGIGVAQNGTFEANHLAADTVRLIVELDTGNAALRERSRVSVDGLVIVPGETNRDPRLQGLAVAGLPPKLRVTVQDSEGRAVQGASVQILGQKAAYAPRSSSRGHIDVRPERLPANLSVQAFGYRPARFEGVRSDRVVKLASALRIKISVDVQTVGRDPAYHLGFFLYHLDEKGRQQGRVYGNLFPWDRIYFDDKGVTRLPVPRPGKYLLSPYVFLSGKDNIGRGGTFAQSKRLEFTVVESEEEQVFPLSIDRAALALDSEGKPVTVTTVRTGGEVVPAQDGAAATGGGS